MNFYQFFSTFVCHFCPPGSGSGFRIRIRIHRPDWIRIQYGSGSRIRIHNPVCNLPESRPTSLYTTNSQKTCIQYPVKLHFLFRVSYVWCEQGFGSGSLSGSGSAWIRINLSCWIRIRTQIADPDPDRGGQKWPKKIEKRTEFSSFEVLDVLFWELKASPVAWESFMEA